MSVDFLLFYCYIDESLYRMSCDQLSYLMINLVYQQLFYFLCCRMQERGVVGVICTNKEGLALAGMD